MPPSDLLVQPLPGVPVPATFPNPFEEGPPCEAARVAAARVLSEFSGGLLAPGLPADNLAAAGAGKMFGVLVVRDSRGEVGYLKAFSGLLDGRWDVPGFVPPLFERRARDAVEPAGERAIKHLLAMAVSSRLAVDEIERSREQLIRRCNLERETLAAAQRENRQRRRELRVHLETSPVPQADKSASRAALDQQSRRDKSARRHLDSVHSALQHEFATQTTRPLRRHRAIERLHRILSAALTRAIHDTYVVPATCGSRPLRDLFPDRRPPAGAGDCAAPKLLGHALTNGLAPLALAEFWVGGSPLSGGRRAGFFYPPCRTKCGPILSFMLGDEPFDARHSIKRSRPSVADLAVLFEDDSLIIVDKPAGLLAVPGRETTDSVFTRLGASHPAAVGPMIVHRLDQDTSGLMVVAKDRDSHRLLQQQFTRREVVKEYVAWLDGDVRGEQGRIELPLRVDLDDRPRQIFDPLFGRAAVTDWRVDVRREGRTRVQLFPRTGRTHQLRVHAVHPLGLGMPIVGDRLYGVPGARMLLHAQALAFQHPRTGRRLSFRAAAPF